MTSKQPVKYCEHCGTEHHRKRAKYCCDACKQAAYRERNDNVETSRNNRNVTPVTVSSQNRLETLLEAVIERLDTLIQQQQRPVETVTVTQTMRRMAPMPADDGDMPKLEVRKAKKPKVNASQNLLDAFSRL